MKVSVIIALYNEEKYIDKCLVSLANQSYKDFEIIVVNDGSTDSSKLKIQNSIRQLADKIKNLRFFEQKHQGPAIARNLGVSKAIGEILVFVDVDMTFDHKFVEDLVRPIQLKQARGTFSTGEYVANWDNVWARCWNYNWNLPDKRRVDPKRLDQARDFRAILKREFEKVGGFDNTGYTDTWTLAKKLGYQPTPTKAVYYHHNPASLVEVFTQAKWVAKREYKFGGLGKIAALVRANFLFSLINGLRKAITKKEPLFVIFKVLYDYAFITGILESHKKYA
jgi:glycosyltransferase involved in cell wall biosynthesis